VAALQAGPAAVTRVPIEGGGAWVVRRHWTRRPRWRSIGRWRRERIRKTTGRRVERFRWWDIDFFPLLSGGDLPAGCVMVILLVVVVLLVVFFGGPLVLFLGEWLIAIGAFVVGVVARVLFRRPWIVAATRVDADGTVVAQHTWNVVGWRASDTARRKVETALRGGSAPEEIVV
jgi:hypothetical protein